ncbi:MAG: hypothetical protein R3185_07315 [Candidatus Thermoplasmatota archaeon]|nr:hypothetical protein [Candidatus Thermoplasmatota archaeon]
MRGRHPILLILLMLVSLVLAGCIGSDDALDENQADLPDALEAKTPDWARTLPETITGLDHVTTTEELESGYQLWVEGNIAYVAAWGAGFYTVDISDPEHPEMLAHIGEHFGHDVDLLHYEDGTTYAALAGSGDGIAIINVTDPRAPEIVSTILGQSGTTDLEGANVHNLRVVPGTHLIYNSRSVDTPGADIVDASDPANPELVQVFGDTTCHDVDFWMEGERAYCAGIRETQIWDITDPAAPSIVTRIHNPAISIHHWAKPAHDGDLLIIGDEFLGATGPFANGCQAGVENPVTGGTTTDTIGALWFYDIRDEATPVPISHLAASELHAAPEACTAHFGQFVGERDQLIIGFLAGGLYLVDFQDVTAPRVVDHLPVGGVPDVAYHHGLAFSVGRDRGMDVISFLGE